MLQQLLEMAAVVGAVTSNWFIKTKGNAGRWPITTTSTVIGPIHSFIIDKSIGDVTRKSIELNQRIFIVKNATFLLEIWKSGNNGNSFSSYPIRIDVIERTGGGKGGGKGREGEGGKLEFR